MEEPIKNPPQPPSSVLDVGNNTRKRPLDNDAGSQNSKNAKLRLILKDLRPHFLEVLRTPDFRNCKAAKEIQEQMKLLLELCKQMVSEPASTTKKAATESQPLPVENKDGQSAHVKENVTTAEQLQTSSAPAKPSDSKIQSSTTSEKPLAEGGDTKGTYVVGGSAFGWNFITFTGKDPIYYGVTKEAFRATYVPPP